jgi:hypothetical protein
MIQDPLLALVAPREVPATISQELTKASQRDPHPISEATTMEPSTRTDTTNRTFGTLRKNIFVMVCVLALVTFSLVSRSYSSMLTYVPESQLSFATVSVVNNVSDQITASTKEKLVLVRSNDTATMVLPKEAVDRLDSARLDSSSRTKDFQELDGFNKGNGPRSRTNRPIVLKRREQRGSWIGNTWIPPKGWKYYSEKELIAFYGKRSLLWVGDSTGWGAARTLYEILKHKTGSHYLQSPAIVVPNKHNTSTSPCDAFGYTQGQYFCHEMPEGRPGGKFLIMRQNTLYEVDRFFRNEILGTGGNMTKSVDVIIVSVGVWEAYRPKDCKDRSGKNRNTNTLMKDTIALLEQLQSSGTVIVWRTSGFGEPKYKKFLVDFNEKAMDLIDNFSLKQQTSNNSTSNLTFVDWGGAVLTRSFGHDRIKGDIVPHYGVEARHAGIQMITNQVAGMLERAVSL